jgi:imidazole glycerol-phosphate synthase subunit HisH
MTDLAIIDYGVGNLRSVERAFAATGNHATVTGDLSVLRQAKGLVLPGVGAFAACMKALSSRGFDELVRDRVAGGTPLLGICVGMQLLFEASEEFGNAAGLNLIRGRVRRLPAEELVPQVGWNQIRKRNFHPILSGIEDDAFVYFVHSYYCEVDDPALVAGETDYGITYPSVIGRGDLCGVQFHPEKSQAVGLQMLANFAHRIRSGSWNDVPQVVQPAES